MATTLGKPVLQSPRLRLRPVTLDDAAALCALDDDPEVRRFVDQPNPPTIEQIRDRMIPRWQAIDENTPGVGYWVAEDLADGRFVGWFLLRPPKDAGPWCEGDLEIGYRLLRERWGNGLATEGSIRLVRYAFEDLAAPRVVATALEENGASIRVMEKLGMTLGGRCRYKECLPEVIYVITPEVWRRGLGS